jgi:hypothetical protein
MRVLKLVNGVMRGVDSGEAVVLRSPDGTRHHLEVGNDGILSTTSGIIYNETLVIGAGGVSTGTPVSLPNSGDYLGEELQVELNSSVVELGSDYEYAGIGVKTEIAFTFDLVQGDEVTFTKVV